MVLTIDRPDLALSEPLDLDGLGLSPGLVRDLALKTLFYAGRLTRSELADALRVSVPVVEQVVHMLMRDGLADVLAADGLHPAAHPYALTQRGHLRAEEALSRNGYVGPAPVPFPAYICDVRRQSNDAADAARGHAAVEAALAGLVLSSATIRRVGWAVASRRPMLIHGDSGNGKTTLAHAIASVGGGTIRVPHAVEIAGQIVRIFDESKHRLADVAGAWSGAGARDDRRWATVERPVIWAGGELTNQSLELSFDPRTHIYEAPLQLKANGGVLVVDDLGRQQLPAVQLLNRWIVALESQADHLTLRTGQMVEVPFDVTLIFSTNLPPHEMADEAFLRRIRYKVRVDDPSPDAFREIFRRESAAHGFTCDGALIDHLLARWYADGRPLRGCHPRDLLDAVVDLCGYDGAPPSRLTPDLLDEACAAYFL